MNLINYDPWAPLGRLHQELDQLFGSVAPDAEAVGRGWRPAVDIREDPERFVLRADLPGVDPKDIDVTMENGVLTIRGERKLEHEAGDEAGRARSERVFGSFFRRFTLPGSAAPERISAKTRNGVLEVTIAKRESVQPRRIEVS
ncbi:MAG: Hsp20/alpha crystallin family protein [Gammaproteobacteria bacterium]|nr:Hsp20/alpha crystallin family protein [Gammaproteobacteria bacterium]